MSYDVKLKDQKTGETLKLDSVHHMRGGIYPVGGTPFAELNITYNYYKHFSRVLGEDGIRELYGKTGEESIPILDTAIAALDDDVDDDYWKPTEGNARLALQQLRTLASMCPDGVWDGD